MPFFFKFFLYYSLQFLKSSGKPNFKDCKFDFCFQFPLLTKIIAILLPSIWQCDGNNQTETKLAHCNHNLLRNILFNCILSKSPKTVVTSAHSAS